MGNGMNQVEARDINGDKIFLNKPTRSAGSVKKFDGIEQSFIIPPQHKEDNIDRIVKMYGQGTGYAKWQKQHYPVKVDISLLQARMLGKVDSDGYVKTDRSIRVFK